MLDHLSISRKLALLLACVAVPALVASLAGLARLASVQAELEATSRWELPLTRRLVEVSLAQQRRKHALEQAIASRLGPAEGETAARMLLARRVAFEHESVRLAGELDGIERVLVRGHGDDTQREGFGAAQARLATLRAELEDWEPDARALLVQLETARARDAQRLGDAIAAALAPTAALDAGIAEALRSLERLTEASVAAAVRHENAAIRTSAIWLLIGLALGALAARALAGNLVRSLQHAQLLAGRVENGVPLVEAPSVRRDEVGELLRGLHRTGHAVRASQRALETAEARTRAIVSGVSDAILTLDARGEVLSCNPAAARLVERPLEDIVDAPVARLLAPESDPDAFFAELLAKPDVTRSLSFSVEAGGVRHVEYRVSELRHDGPLGYVLLARDVTDRREVERAKDEFISTVSHELRTPLTAIRGSLGLVEGGVVGELPEETREMIGIARSNCDRLVRLINDILDLEKIETGRMALVRERIAAACLLEDTQSALGGLAAERGVRLEAQLDDAKLAVEGSRDELVQVLVNLASNAISFTDAGDPVVLRALAREGAVRFECEDRGPGVPPEKREQIFGRFRQVDGSDARDRGGSGLGLAIAKAIVERHEGRIGVESELGRGSVFWFELAAAPAFADAEAEKTEPDPLQPRVLLVEDDADLSRVIGVSLESSGFAVANVPTLAAARERIAGRTPDVVLLDVELPDGSGLELLAELRADPATAQVPVIVVSGRSPDGTFGAPVIFDWIEKPFEAVDLVTSVRLALHGTADAPSVAPERDVRPRVLLVEDDADTRRVLHELLDRAGFACTEAPDGSRALASALGEPPDLIVLDLGLPDLDGFSIVDVLRQGGARSTPLLVYTGRELDVAERDRLRLGLTRHLVKSRAPAEEFINTVQELVGSVARGEPADRKETTR